MKQKYLFTISALSFIVIVAWIGLTLYHTSITSTIDQTLGVQILPITPDFDATVITSLQKRELIQSVTALEQNQASDAASLQETPEAEPTPQVSLESQEQQVSSVEATP